MQLTFTNFGPIASGTINVSPLTILIGPNQSGKSFAAMATHAFLRALRSSSPRHWPYHFNEDYEMNYRFARPNRDAHDVASKLRDELSTLRANEFLIYKGTNLEKLEPLTRLRMLKDSIKASFEEVFATSSKELLRHHTDHGSVRLFDKDWSIQYDVPTGQVTTSFDLPTLGEVNIGYVDRRRRDLQPPTTGHAITFKPSDRNKHVDVSHLQVAISSGLSRILRLPQFPNPRASFYLPAIRSGLLLSHRLFLSLLIRNAQRFGIEPLNVPQMTGVTADFIQSLLRLPEETERRMDKPSSLTNYEEKLTGGHVYSERPSNETLPGFQFKTVDGLVIPLNLTSSTVTEVAPIFLLLQRRLSREVLIVIEEPESHLSPENQITMARFLAALVKSGVYVFITTHSTFLLEQVNNLIVAFKAGKDPGENLNPESVAAHGFKMKALGKGSSIDLLNVDPIDGVDVTAFVNVYESVYNEGFRMKSEVHESS